MSPEMLTLVAPVLAYDRAYDPVVDCGDVRLCKECASLSLNAISETKVENDIVNSHLAVSIG